MKTRVLKFATVFVLAVSLVVSFFAIPVGAADGYEVVSFEFPIDDTDDTYFRFWRWVETSNTMDWNDLGVPYYVNAENGNVYYAWYWSEVHDTDKAGWASIYVGRSKFGLNTYSGSDTVWNEPFTFRLILPEQTSGITYVRLSLREVYGNSQIGARVGNTRWVPCQISHFGSGIGEYSITFPSEQIKIMRGGDFAGLSVHLEFQCSSYNDRMGIGSTSSSLTINYGVGKNPIFDTYPTVNNEIFIQDETLNNQILSSDVVSSMESDVTGLFNNIGSSLSEFRGALILCTQILNKFLNNNYFQKIVQIALALGIAASLLGIAGSIIGASTRRGKGG